MRVMAAQSCAAGLYRCGRWRGQHGAQAAGYAVWLPVIPGIPNGFCDFPLRITTATGRCCGEYGLNFRVCAPWFEASRDTENPLMQSGPGDRAGGEQFPQPSREFPVTGAVVLALHSTKNVV